MLTYSKLVQTWTYSKLQLQFDVLYNLRALVFTVTQVYA